MKELNNVSKIFHLLAEFFEGKGDNTLTHAEATVCLEWLRLATEPISFVMPVALSSKRLMTGRALPMSVMEPPAKTNITPVKQRIKELLVSTGKIASDTVTGDLLVGGDSLVDVPLPEKDIKETAPSSAMSAIEKPDAVIITRTAKKILDVLEGRSIVGIDVKHGSTEPPENMPKLVNIEGDAKLPSFLFNIGEFDTNRWETITPRSVPLTKYHFEI